MRNYTALINGFPTSLLTVRAGGVEPCISESQACESLRLLLNSAGAVRAILLVDGAYKKVVTKERPTRLFGLSLPI